MFARYSLIGALAAAAGALGAASPDALAALGVSRLTALQAMFVIYAILGLAGGIANARIPIDQTPIGDRPVAALGPSRRIVYAMAALFSIDAFAGGFAVQSLVALWLFGKFGLSLSTAGLFFFWSGVLAAFSFPVAAWLSRRIGLAGGASGVHHFMGPTGGYLLAFPVAGALMGWLAEQGWNGNRVILAFLGMLLSNAVCLLLGAAWLAVLIGPEQAIVYGVMPFVVGALLKSALGAATLKLLVRGRSRALE